MFFQDIRITTYPRVTWRNHPTGGCPWQQFHGRRIFSIQSLTPEVLTEV